MNSNDMKSSRILLKILAGILLKILLRILLKILLRILLKILARILPVHDDISLFVVVFLFNNSRTFFVLGPQ
jgi:hypothetical protein